jgi:glycosyltransferase involved in cell wall biosynthesis
MIVANFMDSSLLDLEKKGVLSTVDEIYNPGRLFERVIHFTPHAEDLSLQPYFSERHIQLVDHTAIYPSPVAILRAVRKVLRVFSCERVDVVRGRLPYLGSLIGCICARIRGLPSVVSLGGDNRIVQRRNKQYHYNSRLISFGMEWLVLRMADRIVVPNQFTRTYVATILGPELAEQKCAVIPWLSSPIKNGIKEPSGLLESFGIPAGAAIVPIIGFLNRYKYSDVLFDALENLSIDTADGRPVVFVFCGDGPLRGQGERRFSNTARGFFLGWQPKSVVEALLRHAEFAIVPMSGFVLLEVASIGKPVVTSDQEWHSELVENGKSGLIVEADDPAKWREAVREMVEDPGRAQKMGARLRERYWNEYAPARVVQLETQMYRSLLQRTESAA